MTGRAVAGAPPAGGVAGLELAGLESVLLAAITLLGGALRLFHLGHQPLWVDEAFSWRWSHLPLAALWGAAGRVEYNPPLYYTLQHAWLALGDDRTALLRLPAAILGTLAVPLTCRLGRTLAGPATGLLSALLLALAGLPLAYAQEARGYTLLGDAVLLAASGLALALTAGTGARPGRPSPRLLGGLALYALGSVIAFYTHATAVFLPLLANAALLAWLPTAAGRSRRQPGFLLPWGLANLLVLLAWLGWLPVLLTQLATPDPIHVFIVQPTALGALVDLLRFYGLHDLPQWRPLDLVLALPLPLLALLGAWALRRRPALAPAAAPLILAAFAFGLPLLLLLAGWLGHPLWLPRSVLASLPFGLILVAAGLLALPPHARAALAACVLALFAVNLAGYYRGHDKEPWNRAAAEIAAGWQPGDRVLVAPVYAYAALAFQLRRAGHAGPIIGLEAAPPARPTIDQIRVPGIDGDLAETALADLGPALGPAPGRLWLVLRNPPETDASGRLRATIAALGELLRDQRLQPYLELYLVALRPQAAQGDGRASSTGLR